MATMVYFQVTFTLALLLWCDGFQLLTPDIQLFISLNFYSSSYQFYLRSIAIHILEIFGTMNSQMSLLSSWAIVMLVVNPADEYER